MFYNNPKDKTVYDYREYETLMNALDNKSIHKAELINKIRTLNLSERFFLAAVFLFVDRNVNEISLDSEVLKELEEEFGIPSCYVYPSLNVTIDRRIIVENFKIFEDVESIEDLNSGNEVLKFLEKTGLAKYSKRDLKIMLDSSIYCDILNKGITGFDIFTKDGYFYPPPFHLLVVEFLSYYFYKGISIDKLASFLNLPFELCKFWVERIEQRKSKYTDFSFDTGGTRKVSLTMEEMLECQTWYYLEFFKDLKLDMSSASPKDVVAVSSMYIDTLKKVKELSDKEPKEELLAQYEHLSSTEIAKETSQLIQAREGISKKNKKMLEDNIINNTNKIKGMKNNK
jgi:hypothetical protein